MSNNLPDRMIEPVQNAREFQTAFNRNLLYFLEYKEFSKKNPRMFSEY